MARTLGFGTENLIFVPSGGRLRVHDLYHGRVLDLDVLHSGLAMRPVAFQQLEMRATEKLQSPRKKPRPRTADHRMAVTRFVESLRTISEPLGRPEVITPPDFTLWIRVTDQPAESFFEEDYDEAPDAEPDSAALPLYGTCMITEADDLEIPFPQVGASAAFELLVPEAGGLSLAEPDPLEPLPLVEEFCGVEGVSSKGHSVNLTIRGEVTGTRLGCLPLRRIGPHAFATLYFSQGFDVEKQVTTVLREPELEALAVVLQRSHFERAASGTGWNVFARSGDVVHLYLGLEGKESVGVRELPPMAYVASAAGGTEPGERARLMSELLAVLREGK